MFSSLIRSADAESVKIPAFANSSDVMGQKIPSCSLGVFVTSWLRRKRCRPIEARLEILFNLMESRMCRTLKRSNPPEPAWSPIVEPMCR